MVGYKKNYFESGQEYARKNPVYKIKDVLPKDLIQKKSDQHYDLLLKQKWDFFKGCKKVLDAGCGKGQFIKFNPYKSEVYGIDSIEGEINLLKKEGFKVKVADLAEKIPFNDSEFEGIACFHVLEHIEDPKIIISEFKRVLKNGGVLVLAVPNFSFKRFYADYTHKRPYPKEALYRLLNDNEFYDIEIKNGVAINKFLSGALFFFPKIRYKLEKLWGLTNPWELIAIAKNKK